MSQPPPRRPSPLLRLRPLLPLAGIGAIVGAVTLAFAWSGGHLPSRTLDAPTLIGAIERSSPPQPGFRRSHSKGTCVLGTFTASGDGAAWSSARVFTQRSVPVLGRLSYPGTDPHAADAKARVRSLALLLRTDDGQQWRTAMNSSPFFAVATPEDFKAQAEAATPDPATGKPDPARMAAFLAGHPQARAFQAWAKSAPWSNSWANTPYNSLNTFIGTAADGSRHALRWTLRPQAPFVPLSPEQREQADANFLVQDLSARLAAGPVRWDLVLTEAGPGDRIDDASYAWPAERAQRVAGVLELKSATPQATGECRDINFDPLVLPQGLAASGDPLLAARSAVYSQSFNRREREIARGQAHDAIGEERP
ncbi:catalase family peroxidase [Stenotrophomonas sp. 24(2023)]|uniref:catalase family peroxidase n=1 Tax=Stenotrophomonas sp. 24(2023) TaxID=3068324 RepID=UPI0027DF6C43|nr:catalase family peroxidase [Stenotrophomonas sp. 24(2023)]WMJ71224.1 catalase family peroxidase [Stenotrophomonas sp. 24(2023)]